MLPNLEKLKDKVSGRDSGGEVSLPTSIYFLIKELKCLPDVLGRDYEVEYKPVVWWKPSTWNRIVRIRQLPMKIPSMIVLFKEMEEDYKRQKKEADKMNRKGRGRR